MQLEKNARSFAQVVTGNFIATMRLLILQILCRLFLAKHRITRDCQLPYSPDLAPCNFWL